MRREKARGREDVSRAGTDMFAGHNAYLVALSVVIAILGGYTGLGLAARVRGTPGMSRRVLLAGAAGFIAVSIWTMHFVGMLAAPIPDTAVYLVLPTIVSFLICAVVVGVSLFFVSIGEASHMRLTASALLLGLGIVSMHYVGIHGLAGPFDIEHRHVMIALSALIAVGAAYGGLRVFLAGHVGRRLALSAFAFGVAVSGMHYTAMAGMTFVEGETGHHVHAVAGGLVASPQILAITVALLCFFIVAGFLLFLVPEPRQSRLQPAAGPVFEGSGASVALRPLPLGGIGQPPASLAMRVPVEGADGTHFIDVADIRSLSADAHYTRLHDGVRERMCPWSISQAEAQLDPHRFMRIHRSHIVSIPHVTFMRKERDGAVVELDGGAPHLVPVSRARIAELRARLGMARRDAARNSQDH